MPNKDIEKRRATQRKSQAKYKDKINANSRKYYAEHKEQEAIKSKEWRDNNKEYRAHKRLEYYYGITIDIYNKLYDLQGGKCAICGKHQSELDKRLYVDHDHDTKTVRGLLCQKCNSALGMFNDRLDLVRKAVVYLEGK